MCAGTVPSAVLARTPAPARRRRATRFGERDVHVGAVQPPAGAEHRPHRAGACRPGRSCGRSGASSRCPSARTARCRGRGRRPTASRPSGRRRAPPRKPRSERREERRDGEARARPGIGRVDAERRASSVLRDAAEARVRRRDRVEARVGDHAAGRPSREAHGGMCLKSPVSAVPVRAEHLAAEQDRRHEQPPLRAASESITRLRQVPSARRPPASGRSGRRRARGCSARGSPATRERSDGRRPGAGWRAATASSARGR